MMAAMTGGDLWIGVTAEPVKTRKAATLGEAGHQRSAHDAYFTEPWVTRALLQAVDFHLPDLPHPVSETIWEPACGDGGMADVLAMAGYRVIASDIAAWGYGAQGMDFLDASAWRGARDPAPTLPIPSCAAIVTNPPFDQAVEFVLRALELTREARGKVAILQRHEWDAASEREGLFEITGGCKYLLPRRPYWIIPPAAMGVCPEAARLAAIPINPKTGKPDSPRFAFSWYVFDWRAAPPWIRRRLPDPDAAPAAVGRLL